MSDFAGIAGKGLSGDDIAKLMGKTRTRNFYGPFLIKFAESDEPAINPKDIWPVDFGERNANTIYQGFVNAIKAAKLQDTILLRKSDDDVFLLHKDRVTLALEKLAEERAAQLEENALSQNGNGNHPDDSE